MRNIKLIIEYDGTDFLGWQSQSEGRTVQSEISEVLYRITGESVTLIGSGRTDTGVHARGQVAHFTTTSSSVDAGELMKALNGLLPDDIVIHGAEDVPEAFHSRYDAKGRRYRYTITISRKSIGRQYRWYVGYRLDPDVMNKGAMIILGEHEFDAFSKTGSGVDHYRCDVRRSEWKSEGTALIYEIEANRFVRGMVRALVGTMVDLGRGFITMDEFRSILESKDRSRAGQLAPALGLVLEEVRY